MRPVVIFGASRQGRVVLETLRAQGGVEVIGYLDDDEAKHGSYVGGLPVLGGTGWAAAHAGEGVAAVVAVGNNTSRVAIGSRLRTAGVEMLNAIHPAAVVMAGTTLGTGILICAAAVLVTEVCLEDDVVVNTGATIDHGSVLHVGSQLASGVHTAGCVKIGREAFVGVGAALGPSVAIGDRTIVGAGSVVLSDLPSDVLAFGTPARVVRRLSQPVDWRKLLAGA